MLRIRDRTVASIIAMTTLALSVTILSFDILFHIHLSVPVNKYTLITALTCFGIFLFMLLFYARDIKVICAGFIIVTLLIWLLTKVDAPYIIFELNKKQYIAKVANTEESSPKFVVFDYAHGGDVYAFWEWIIFDETDQIGLPENERSEAWKSTQLPSQFLHNWYASRDLHHGSLNDGSVNSIDQCRSYVRSLEGHFFYAGKFC